jgi:hypothetical protein
MAFFAQKQPLFGLKDRKTAQMADYPKSEILSPSTLIKAAGQARFWLFA